MATTETPQLNELSHRGGHFCQFLEANAKLMLEINGTVVAQASYTLDTCGYQQTRQGRCLSDMMDIFELLGTIHHLVLKQRHFSWV